MGKDYTASLIALTFFLAPWLYFDAKYVRQVERQKRSETTPSWLVHTRRVVTTSVKEDHLDVLWGEIGRAVATAEIPLTDTTGGPLVVNDKEIRVREERDAAAGNVINYLRGMVSKSGEGMSGHHAAYNLLIVDEASGADDRVYEFAQGWAKKMLIFGNPNPCENFFRKMVRGGDIE